MDSNCYEIDEILNEAIMTGVPSILVEGIDDISIYTDICKKANVEAEIYPIESVEGFGEGCDEVIRALGQLDTLPVNKQKITKNILGIIDRDVREFRGELPDNDAILILKYYSIESHFVSTSATQSTLKQCTKATSELIDFELANLLLNKITPNFIDLYYFSLESLKNALERDYNSNFCYSYGHGRLNDQNAKELIEQKKVELDSFAENLNLDFSLSSLKSFAKGKWILDVFAEELINAVQQLPQHCRSRDISICHSCVTSTYHKCLYRLKDGINKNTLKSLAINHVDSDEFNYIVRRIESLNTDVTITS